MIAEIVTTGSELLLGEILNTNVRYLAKELNRQGMDVVYQTTVGDNRLRMEQVLRTALQRADFVITSGGLGPTQGDITREVSAHILERKLSQADAVAQKIRAHFARVERPMTASCLRQAQVPEGAVVLENPAGTAPGLFFQQGEKYLVNLPGPPEEMRAVFSQSLLPLLRKIMGSSAIILSRELHTAGIGESMLEDKIRDLILQQSNPTLALLVRPDGVLLRLTAKAVHGEEAKALLDGLEGKIRQRLGDFIYGMDEETLPLVLGRMLAERGLSVSCAESCTGGLVTSLLTDIPSSSLYVKGSVVSYAAAIKAKVLGVSEASLQKYGAVSAEVAEEMALGVQRVMETSLGISVTGLAGPGGAEPEKPVGLVYIAVSYAEKAEVQRYIFSGDRQHIKLRAAYAAIEQARRFIKLL